jgi:hypothetical protein
MVFVPCGGVLDLAAGVAGRLLSAASFGVGKLKTSLNSTGFVRPPDAVLAPRVGYW